jgi:hypothetical protein
MPGRPRPAFPNARAWPGSSWLVVEGVTTVAGSPVGGVADG